MPSAGRRAPSTAFAAHQVPRAFAALQVLVGAIALLAILLGVSGDTRLRPAALVRVPRAAPVSVAETERDGRLRVRVQGADSAPLGGAEVRVFWQQQRRYFDAGRAATDASGTASLARIPRGRVWVLAEARGFARASTQLVMDGGERDVTLVLPRESELRVRVTDEALAPLSDATLLVTTADPLPFGALTDQTGNATLTRLGPGPWTVQASAPGFESVTRSGVSGGAVEIALRRLGSILVRVEHEDGSPAAGATVEIGGATLWPARSSSADANGTCRIGGLLAGSYDLRATKGQLVSRVLMGVQLERGQSQTITLKLEPGRLVTALVTDGEGESPHLVAGADVVLAEEGLSTFPLRGRTGSDGKVVLGPISSGPATLSGRAPDFVGSAVVAVPNVLTEPVRLPLRRGGTLRGEVVDARGFPIDGASIEIVGSDSMGLPISETPQLLRFRRSHFSWALPGPPPLVSAGELGVMPGPIPPIPGSNAALGPAAIEANDPLDPELELSPWITDSGGRFLAAPVTPGTVRALVRHPDFVEGVSDAVTLAPGAEASIKVTLLRGGSLEGRLKDERDQPIAGAEIQVLAERGTFQRSTVTASDGSFAFSALPREVTVNVRRPDNPSRVAKRVPLRIEEGKKETLEITLPAPREPITVSVVDDDDEALELAEINVLSLDPSEPLRTTGFSDRDGKLQVPDAEGLQLRLSAQAPGFARQTLVVSAGDAKGSIAIKLVRGALVKGRVTTLRGRRGVEGAQVTMSSQGLRKTATTDADGDYALSDVAIGSVKLYVSHPDFAEGSFEAKVESPGRRDRAFELPSIDLEEPGAVEGEVLDERGEPVSGARVAIGRAPTYLPAGTLPRGAAVTDARGAFSLQGLPSGVVTIDAFSPDRGRGSAKVEVRSTRTESGVRITLRQSGSDQDPFAPAGVAITLGERGAGASLEVVVVAVAENSEAERAGIQAGDVLTSIDDARPSSMHDARARLSGAAQSDVVVTVSRNGATQRLSVLREAVRK